MTLFARFRSPERHARFRSGDRDEATDRARLALVRAAIDEAIASIDLEAAGVRRRLEEATARAAHLSGNDDLAGDTREAADERLLSEAERQLMGAARRLHDLKIRRRRFEDLLPLVADEPAPLAPRA
ncbi:MAG: hypothetical protein QM722_00615 [Piscinibacter sp.]